MSNIFPDLKHCKEIGLDIETYDPNLLTKGPGAIRKDGFILGIGISTDDGFEHYYPLNHEDGINYDKKQVTEYFNTQLKYENYKIGANITYDLQWFAMSDIFCNGNVHDIQIAEPLINEEKPNGYSLQALSLFYLGKPKQTDILDFTTDLYGIKLKHGEKIQNHLRHFDQKYVGPYCIADARQAREIFQKQKEILISEELEEIYELERKLIPIFLKMKLFGVKVDLNKADEISEQLEKEQIELQKNLNFSVGKEINVWSNKQIEEVFKFHGVPYIQLPLTKKMKEGGKEEGNPSFTGEWLEKCQWDFAQKVFEIRKIDRMRNNFINGTIQESSINGRIHACINQLASDEYGTRTGRLSYSNPNLQQIPKRNEKWRKIIRSLFIPEENHFWGQQDYSQQEPRILVHYAYLRGMQGAKEAREKFQDYNADYHQMVTDMAKPYCPTITRFHGKELNLGSAYGMGKNKIKTRLNVSEKDAENIYNAYHEAVPYVHGLSNECMRFAQNRGWIKTLLGRKRHFDWWGPVKNWEKAIYGIENAKEKWPSEIIERQGVYKALNALIQGSAADMTKKAILDIYEQTGEIRFTQLQVHDELDGSYQNIEEVKMINKIMSECVQLEVPIRTDSLTGLSWGEVE